MKTFLLLLLMLAGGFAYWMYEESKKSPEKQADGTIVHTVVKGDTLTALSKEHDTTVASIKQRNALSSDTIRIGQQLTILPGEKLSKPTPPAAIAKKNEPARAQSPQPASPKPSSKSNKALAKKELPKSTVMETSQIAIDIDDRNQVYLKNREGKFTPAGTIVYGSHPDAQGREVKTVTYRDLKGRETTLPGAADPEAVIRLGLKKQ